MTENPAGTRVVSGHRRAEEIRVVDPSTEDLVDTFVSADDAEIRLAASQARQALARWAGTRPRDRATLVATVGQRLRECAASASRTLEREVGTSLLGSAGTEVRRTADLLQRLSESAPTDSEAQLDGATTVLHEARGVVAAITPCQQPLLQTASMVAPALLAGCAVVLKPSTLAPFTGLLLAKLFEEAGLPAGTLTVVLGYGSVVGEMLASHPDVDVVAFTGSAEAGQRVAATAVRTGKHLVLRDGRHAATLVLDSTLVPPAVERVVRGYLQRWREGRLTSGRLIVPRASMPCVESLVLQRLQHWNGSAEPRLAAMAPLATRGQQLASLELIESSVGQGARVVVGGPDVSVPGQGYFLPLTVLSDVDVAMDVARYEVSGPLLCILGHDGPAHARSIANRTPHAAFHEVWGVNPAETMEVAAGLNVSAVRINGRAALGGGASWHPERPLEPDVFCRRKTVVIAATAQPPAMPANVTTPLGTASNSTAKRSKQ